ncbi:dihydroorotase [Psychroflexus planctonicus]|uniref:Dihydroorotase n=1 Tax=Psychroflexus planctonicus TaxID=1526575 RepID=A0ABQ1SCP6_9FLAO|nr:dihydroorotase [Psychroflexus planctonicus]GGE28613.1 dihydroorotase [Psychroflexus planctonicus]
MTIPILIKDAKIINEREIKQADILIENGKFVEIGQIKAKSHYNIINAKGKLALPGVIDAQVHFRDPGFTYKADIYTESKAAVTGGVTSFIDMPNTYPNVLSISILNEKYKIAAHKSLANFGFFLGINTENLDEVLQMDTSHLLAISDDGLYFTKKGNLLADRPDILEKIFEEKKDCIVAIHAEKEAIVEENERKFNTKYGEHVPVELHPKIRSVKACYSASKQAIDLAKKHQARLHILHLTTGKETELFSNQIALKDKKITTEVCVQNLWFSDKDYKQLGTRIKWNPAIKTEEDRQSLLKALINDKIDIITTDHAPHTLEEKEKTYFKSMSGAPMVQHGLNIMLELYKKNQISLEKIVEKMCHNPAILYKIDKRGFIKKGFFADLVLVDPTKHWTVHTNNLKYKCGWSPLEGTEFTTQLTHTIVNGNIVYQNGSYYEGIKGKALIKA